METENSCVAAWLEEGIRYAHSTDKERVEIVTDCVGAGIYLLKGGGSHVFLTRIVKAIWRLCVTHGISLRPRWIPGTEMCNIVGDGKHGTRKGLSVDDLSRLKYAKSTEWVYKDWVVRRLKNWLHDVHHDGRAPRWLHAKQIYSGEAQQRDLLAPGSTWVCFPPTEMVGEWVGHAFQCGARMVLVVPVQHSAHDGTVKRATVVGQHKDGVVRGDEESLPLGPVYKVFKLDKGSKWLCRWQYRAVLCDFGAR